MGPPSIRLDWFFKDQDGLGDGGRLSCRSLPFPLLQVSHVDQRQAKKIPCQLGLKKRHVPCEETKPSTNKLFPKRMGPMFETFRRLFASRQPSANASRPGLKPQVEMLETREVPAAYINAGNLMLVGTNLNDSVSVNNYDASWVSVSFNGA